jgi:GT2 family glycosyltransferase
MLQKLPIVSFVIATRNRCEVLLSTLQQIQRCGLAPDSFDVHVIDNASNDGTARRLRDEMPWVRLITLSRNNGAVARNEALPHAHGRFVVFLDDDSYPVPGAIARMIKHFELDPELGAAGFTVTLPDGRRECSAYPDVFIGCGVGIRRRALRLVGGYPDDYFMQAEEYDLSLRLLEGGWKVRTFDDMHVEHLKSPQARLSARTMRLDVRNNLYLALRRFPLDAVLPMGLDWMQRYWWIASTKKLRGSFVYGLLDGCLRSILRPRRAPVSDDTFEAFAKLAETQRRMAAAVARDGLRRVLLIDAGKNLHAYWRAARTLGVEIVAIADANLASPARRYHGIRIVDDATARTLRFDAAIISNLSPVHASARCYQWRIAQDRPVIDLFEDDFAERYQLRDNRPPRRSARSA